MLLNEATEIIKQEDIDQMLSKFKKINPNLSYIKNFEFELNLREKTKIAKKPYSIPFKLLPKLQEHINDLLKMKIIRKSHSPFGAPAFIKLKPNGDIRLLIDYRELNDITIKEAYPFPNLKDQISDLKGPKVFSQIDLEKGYYQIKIKSSDTYKTAFILPNGQFEFLRMPFGLSNAPRAFQRAMQIILEGFEFVKIFLDDILVFSPDIATHKIHLSKILTRLIDANVKINYDKSSFFLDQVRYLGLIISKDGVKCDIKKLSEFENIPPPKTLKQLQKFIGFINWFRDFVPRLSQLILPITNKLKHNQPFVWTKDDEIIKDRLISLIKAQIELKHPDFCKPFSLHTDASELGISAILTQDKNLIGLFSKKLNTAESNYSTVEKELLAVVYGLTHFRNIVWGNKVTVFTDSKNITFRNAPSNSRIIRWKLAISEFDYNFEHVEGKTNNGPDFLSRNFLDSISNINQSKCIQKIRYHTKIKNILSLNNIAKEQTNIQEEIQRSNPFKLKQCIIDSYNIYVDKQGRPFIPPILSNELLELVHIFLAHPGINRTYKTLHKYIFIPRLKIKIKALVDNCKECQINKSSKNLSHTSQGSLHQSNFNDVVATDIVGPYNTDNIKDNFEKYFIITFIDMHSRVVRFHPVVTISSEEVINGIKNWVSTFGPPKCLLSDQGKQYTSNAVSETCKLFKIEKIFSTPYNPTGNSIAERINKIITTSLKCLKHLNFIKAISKIENAQNNSYHTSIGCSPYEFINKFSVFDPLRRDLTISSSMINKKIIEEQKDTSKIPEISYKIGNEVLIKNLTLGKLESEWIGPGKIISINEYGNILQVHLNNKIYTVNIRRVKPFKKREDVM